MIIRMGNFKIMNDDVLMMNDDDEPFEFFLKISFKFYHNSSLIIHHCLFIAHSRYPWPFSRDRTKFFIVLRST